MAQCFLFEAMFPAFHVSYGRLQLQQDWAQDSNRGSWISPAPRLTLGQSSLTLGQPKHFWTGRARASSLLLDGQCWSQTHPHPVGWWQGLHMQGAAQDPRLCSRYLACSLQRPGQESAQTLQQKTSRSPITLHSLVQQWLSASPREMPYQAPAAPFPTRC